jgi:hypothetical protein
MEPSPYVNPDGLSVADATDGAADTEGDGEDEDDEGEEKRSRERAPSRLRNRVAIGEGGT